MKKLLCAATLLLVVAAPVKAQVLKTEKMELGGEPYTLVMYSNKCYVAKGEGVKVIFFDAGGNRAFDVCRTGGGGEPALFTLSDGTVTPALF